MTAMPGRYIDSIIETLYGSISGPASKERNWDQMRTLFLPGSRIMRADVSEEGCHLSVLLEINEFIESIAGFLCQRGFYGREVVRRTEISGSIAKVVSVYEGRFDPDDQKPFRRGTTELKLYNDGQRWWIVNMLLREYRREDRFSSFSRSKNTASHGVLTDSLN